ncbi:MAG TPA: MerC domain-containing protein [Chitinophagaceae bacterium]|nr:MerC domain-containing protein [Chitinophagaceae bacterium]
MIIFATKLRIVMKKRLNWDAMGVFVSIACAIHCALLPLFLTSLPLLGINIIHNRLFEVIMIAIAFGVGLNALYHGYKNHHRSLLPVALFVGGMLFLIAKQIWHAQELLLLVPAVILIVTAHLVNYRSCRVSH